MTDSLHDPAFLPESCDPLPHPSPESGDTPSESGPGERYVAFEDLTLAEALRVLRREPLAAARAWWTVLVRDRARVSRRAERSERLFAVRAAREEVAGEDEALHEDRADLSPRRERWRLALWSAALLMAMHGGVLLRRAALDPAMHREKDPGASLTWLGLAALLVIGVELWAAQGARLAGWFRRWRAGQAGAPAGASADTSADTSAENAEAGSQPSAGKSPSPEPAPEPGDVWVWVQAHIGQLVVIPFALLASGLAYALNVRADAAGRVVDVVLTGGGTFAWALSVIGWLWVLTGAARVRAYGRAWRQRLAGVRVTWTLPALAAITGLAAVIRLVDLRAVPPEMTSDHIEKLLDALRVHEGYYAVFFPNNGGREGFQMYLVALVAQIPGVGFSFEALKLATVIEGVITIPVLWWMARQVFGTDTAQDRRLGNWVGLVLAGLVAISSWHLMLSRLGLRIVLTPLTTALVIGLLARMMRGDRLRDHLALGLVLGAGVYFYQANRMLPLVVAAGAGLAALTLVIRARRAAWRMIGETAALAAVAGLPLAFYRLAVGVLPGGPGSVGARLVDLVPLVAMVWLAVVALAARGRRSPVVRLGGGMLAAAVMALALMVPMIHYSQVQPDQFWNRTRGRMFGEEAFVRLDPASGSLVTYEPSLREQVERFWDERAVFIDNYADALRMAHWEGDAGWISNPGGYPALDGPTGGLLALGAVLWAAWAIRRRDPVFVLIPAAVLIMLLPSALTLAYTIENPSFTRASGVIPPAFLMAALPLGVWAARLAEWPGARVRVRARRIALGGALAGMVIAGVLWASWSTDRKVFFTDYRLQYASSWKPYHAIAAPMRAFAEGEGSYGNAFMVAYPHWLDHRILGAVAGDIRWPNGLIARDVLPLQIARNAGTPYAYDPTRPMFVMFNSSDTETADWLRAHYPGGEMDVYRYQYEGQFGMQTGEFTIYLAPPGSAQ